MSCGRASLVGFLAALIAGCSSGSSGDGSSSGLVASTPLRGSVSGTEFVAMFARARKSASKPDKKSIEIFDKPIAGCTGGIGAGPPRYVVVSAPWQAGFAADLSFGEDGQLGSFIVDRNGTITIVVSATGRVEVLEAPLEKGAKGKIRLRMSEKEHTVEGEVVVEVCE